MKTEMAPSVAPDHPPDKSELLDLALRPSRLQQLSAFLSMFILISLLPHSLPGPISTPRSTLHFFT